MRLGPITHRRHFFCAALLAAAALLVFFLLRMALFLTTPAGEPRGVIVRISPGTSLNRIAELLEEKRVVTSSRKFRWLARLSGKGSHIKAGEYELNASSTPLAILTTLASGKVRQIQVTIPEGYNMAQIGQVLDTAGVAEPARFLAICSDPALIHRLGVEGDSLEGYLYPDTYSLAFFMTEEDVARIMVRRFLAVWKNYAAQARTRGRSMRQVIILASIVEKETGQPEERPLIAAVFSNRLRCGMRLQSDPTVIYGLTDYKGNLTRCHLLTPHPYNTYCIPGLPRGPIASPGEAAIRAALNPAHCDYLYFVSRNDGSHKFSCSLAEHNQAVAYFQKCRITRNASRAAAAAVKAAAGRPNSAETSQSY
ncbi:MAG: endolytic transglycosylase MltG [Pseudomonadota bacterium]